MQERNLRADLYTLHQLVNLLIRHLLSELRKNVSQLSCADETVALLIEDLEATDELLLKRCNKAENHRATVVEKGVQIVIQRKEWDVRSNRGRIAGKQEPQGHINQPNLGCLGEGKTGTNLVCLQA